MLTAAELQVEVGSRAAWLAISLTCDDANKRESMEAGLYATITGVLRPGGIHAWPIQMSISSHAIDRIIQRGGTVSVPLSDEDIESINAEFTDLLHYAGPAVAALNSMERGRAAETNVLLPSHHGFFLGDFDVEEKLLRIKTFVDEERLWNCERQALTELQSVNPGKLALASLVYAAPGWFVDAGKEVLTRLQDAWHYLGKRVAEEAGRTS